MPHFGRLSTQRLSTCDERLQDICNEAIQIYDFSVLCGHRDKEAQNKAFKDGNSKLEYPKSKHNKIPSKAVDIAPYPYTNSTDMENILRYYYLAGIMKAVATSKGIKLRWGGDWQGDNDFTNNLWDDLAHFELI